MGLGKLLLKGVKGIVSLAANEVTSAIGLVSQMENYSDERLTRIAQDKCAPEEKRRAAAYVLKKRGY